MADEQLSDEDKLLLAASARMMPEHNRLYAELVQAAKATLKDTPEADANGLVLISASMMTADAIYAYSDGDPLLAMKLCSCIHDAIAPLVLAKFRPKKDLEETQS